MQRNPRKRHVARLRPFACGALITLLAACSQPIEEADKNLLLTVGHLEPHGLTLVDGYEQWEEYSSTNLFLGAKNLEYEFAPESGAGLPYIYSTTEIHRNAGDACLAYHATKTGVRLGGFDFNVRNDIFAYGEASEFALLEQDGQVFGASFGMCQGKSSMMVLLAALDLDSRAWPEVLMPVIQAIEANQQSPAD